MRHSTVGILLSALLALPAVVSAAEQGGVGIVKGMITIGGKPAPDAVVSVEGVPADQIKAQMALVKARQATLDQRDLKFNPRVLAILVGTTVDFPNHDTSWHNVYSKGGVKNFDLGLYAPGKTRNIKFDKPGVARILCNAHPNMEAFIVVKEHPYFSAADSRGNYEIKNVPLGKVRVEVWYPSLGVTSQIVELVRDQEVVAINIDLKKP